VNSIIRGETEMRPAKAAQIDDLLASILIQFERGSPDANFESGHWCGLEGSIISAVSRRCRRARKPVTTGIFRISGQPCAGLFHFAHVATVSAV
jgi:hypothetical protein